MSDLLLKLSDAVTLGADQRTGEIVASALAWKNERFSELSDCTHWFNDACDYTSIMCSLREWFNLLSTTTDPDTFQTMYYAVSTEQQDAVRKILYWQDHLGGTASPPCLKCVACLELRERFHKLLDTNKLTFCKPHMSKPDLKKKSRGDGTTELQQSSDDECGYNSMLRSLMCDP